MAQVLRENELLKSSIIQFRDTIRDKVWRGSPGVHPQRHTFLTSFGCLSPGSVLRQARSYREQEALRRSAHVHSLLQASVSPGVSTTGSQLHPHISPGEAP